MNSMNVIETLGFSRVKDRKTLVEAILNAEVMDKVYIESHIEATIDWVSQCHKVATVRDVDTEE